MFLLNDQTKHGLLTVQFEHGNQIPDYGLFEHSNTRLSGHLNTGIQVPTVFEQKTKSYPNQECCMKGMKGMGDILAPENGNLRLNWTVRLNPEGRKNRKLHSQKYIKNILTIDICIL